MFTHEPLAPVHTGSGLAGTLKLIAVGLLLALAGLGSLTVFDVLSFESMLGIAAKFGVLAAIATVVTVAAQLLAGPRRV